MRKWITIVLLLALISALALTGHAVQSQLSVENVTVKPGETVYLKLKLTESVTGDAVGVQYTYDSAVLKPLESSSTWARNGVLQDFDAKKGAGVWADTTASDMKGLVCTLAFKVVSKEAHFDTEITCTLIVKNKSKDVGTYTTNATVSTYCDHEYSKWEEMGTLGHTRACKHCDRKQTQSHHWDDGVTTPITGKPGMAVTTYTCKECGATNKFEHNSSTKPTVPEETLPPETKPNDPSNPIVPDHTQPTTPGGNQGGSTQEPDHTHPTTPGGNQGGSSQVPDHTHPTQPDKDDHTHTTIPGFNGDFPDPTFPGFDQNPTVPTTPDHDHDHDHGTGTAPTLGDHDHDHTNQPLIPTVDSATKTRNMLIFFGTLAVLGGAAYFFTKKKRR